MGNKIVSFVTGANGFVGSHLVDYLLEQGHEVHAIVRSSSNLQWLDGKDVTLHTCGLNSAEDLKVAFQGANYIYHIAGVVKALTKEGFMKGNVEMTRNVMEASAHISTIKRVLVTSSMAATGYAEMGSDVDENSPLKPIEPYGDSKVAQEEVAKEYADRVPTTIVRPPGVYGPRDTEIFAFFKAINNGVSAMMGFTPKEMSLIHVRDLVQGMFQAATNENSVGEVYFLGSLECYNWKELGDYASKAMNKKTITIKIPHFVIFILGFFGQILESWFGMDVALNKDRAYRITRPSWYCNSNKAVKELGFQQTVSIEDGFKSTVDWYKEKGWL
ncbi:MAG: dihydroflavonol-4-reductase [Aureispira sp.]|jgi:dihydroflavonol-4-reductase